MEVRVKICGLTTAAAVEAAAQAGAAYGGFVSFPKSPRHLELDAIAALAAGAPPSLCRVALSVNASDDHLAALVEAGVDMLQLHGAESPERVAGIRARFGLPVMKVVGIASPGDLPALDEYAAVADQLLVDAKPAPDAALPGGMGAPFDWRLIAGRDWPVPWMLAGGLTPDNVAEAVRLTGARQVDVSSGVESAPGVKDPALIRAFVAAAQAAPVPAP
ncbi:MAG: phosphoribosylanthranilate isomerase [Pseudomonadota bacterium]